MEMEFRDTSSRRRRLLLFLGLALAVMAGVWAYSLATQGQASQEPPPTRSVLVTTRDIPARTVIGAGDVRLRELTDDVALQFALTTTDEVVGRVNTVPLVSGQVVYPNVLVTTSADAAFTLLEPNEVIGPDTPNWRAVSVMVPNDRAVGGQILAGQRVDLIVSVELKVLVVDEDGELVEEPTIEGYQSGKTTRLAIQDLEVLEVRPDDGIYVLKVDAHQAEEIYHVATAAPGAFSLALRADGDTRPLPLEGYGETTDRLIMQYLYPVPRMVDLTELTRNDPSYFYQPGSGLSPVGPSSTPQPTAEPTAPPQPEPQPEATPAS